jgi:small subunit ribosomal protein S2
MQTNKQFEMKKTNNSKKMASLYKQTKKMETGSLFHLAASSFAAGEIFSLKINALGPKKMGLVSLNNGLTMLVPNVNLGDFVKVKIEKFLLNPNKKKTKYAIGSVVQVLKKANKINTIPEMVEVGKVLDLTIKRKGPKNSGLVPISDKFTILVPNTTVGQTVKVQITKVKSTYAFAKILSEKANLGFAAKLSTMNQSSFKAKSNQRYNIVIPSNAKTISNFFVLKLNGNLLFVKKSLGIKVADSVKIQMVRIYKKKYAMAKILQVNPISKKTNQKIVKEQMKKMIASGMHYGERAIRCNAKMRSYLWLRKKGKNKNRPFLKRGRHVINLLKTRLCLKKAFLQLSKYAANGQTFLFVGTKKPAASLIARTAVLSQTSFFVNTRWLGGMLTNWKTILKSISQIKPILKEKQKGIQNLLEKRQKIKDRLFSKVNLLRKKSRKLMTKGKKFIQQLQKNPNYFIQKSHKLIQKKNLFLQSTKNLIEKYTALSQKQERVFQQMKLLKAKENQLLEQKKFLKNQILNDTNSLKDFKKLFLIGQELMKLKKETKENGKILWAVSYERFNQLLDQKAVMSQNIMVPSPPNEILYKILSTMKMKFGASAAVPEPQLGTPYPASKPNNFAINNNSQNQMNLAKSTTEEKNAILLSKLLDKFTLYLPFMKKYMSLLIVRFQNSKNLLEKFNKNIQQIHNKLFNFSKLTIQIQDQLIFLQSLFLKQQQFFQIIKKKLRQLSSEQRLLKFLPKLRYLPTTRKKMYERVELLMKKFVDPRMNYPMDQIYDQKLKFTSKKIAAVRKQRWQRLEKYFGGITQMSKMNKTQISKNVAIIIGQQEEMNAVRECKKLGIKMFTIIDTNCNPKLSDHIIPANDDSRTSIQYILGQMLTYIRLSQKLRRKVFLKKSLLKSLSAVL